MLAQEVLQRAFTKDGITFLEPRQLSQQGSLSGEAAAEPPTAASSPTAASGNSFEGEAPTSSLRPGTDSTAAEGRLMMSHLNPLTPPLLPPPPLPDSDSTAAAGRLMSQLNPVVPSLLPPPPPLLQRLGLDETYAQLFGSIPVSEGGAELLQVGFLRSLILPPFSLPFSPPYFSFCLCFLIDATCDLTSGPQVRY